MTGLVLHDVPATPEGKAFIRQLRKYLPKEYKIRTRGNNKDRKGLAEKTGRRHDLLRQAVPVYLADRLRVYIEQKLEGGIQNLAHQWWYHNGRGTSLGPFKTYEAALAAKRITEGTS